FKRRIAGQLVPGMVKLRILALLGNNGAGLFTVRVFKNAQQFKAESRLRRIHRTAGGRWRRVYRTEQLPLCQLFWGHTGRVALRASSTGMSRSRRTGTVGPL